MKQLYTFVTTCCDGTEAVSQEYGTSVAEALDKWTRHVDPDGFIESLTVDERKELAEDFSVSPPTIFGIGTELGINTKVDDLDGVWVVSTTLRSDKFITVYCIRSAAQE